VRMQIVDKINVSCDSWTKVEATRSYMSVKEQKRRSTEDRLRISEILIAGLALFVWHKAPCFFAARSIKIWWC